MAIKAIDAKFKDTSYEIVVFDNASTDGSRDFFESLNRTNFIYVYSDKNLGYGAGNNRGFKQSSGDVIILVNPDVTEISGTLDSIFRCLLDKSIGVIGPQIVYPDGRMQANGGGRSTFWTFLLQTLRLGYLARKLKLVYFFRDVLECVPWFKNTVIGLYLRNFNANRTEEIRDWYWISGAFLILRRDIFLAVHGFDENFFLYNEDEDLCIAIRSLGYRVIQDSSLVVTHMEGATHKGKSGSRLGRAYIERMKSRLYFASKHFSKTSYFSLKVYLSIFSLLVFLVELGKLCLPKAKDFFLLSKTILFFRPPKKETRMI